MRVLQRRRGFGAANLIDALTGGLTSLYDTVEMRTSVTPPAIIDLQGLADDSPPSPVTQFLKPTIILSGPAGTKVIAPYGEAQGGWAPAVVSLSTVVLAGFMLGWYARGRWRG